MKIKDKKIALFAGALRLPFLVRDELRAQGWEVFVVGIRGFFDPALKPDLVIRLGAGGTAAKECKRRGITLLTFAGGIGHPNLSDIRPDLWSVGVFLKVLRNQKGYDSMTHAAIAGIESKGFKVVGAQDLCPGLSFEPGIQTKAKPSSSDKKDIERAMYVSRLIGKEDIGTAVVVDKQVFALEAAEGTANMLKRVIELRRDRRRKPSGVFAKMIKPGQDLRAEITAIGIDTVLDVITANLRGIVIDSKNCFVVDREKVVELANKHKIFIVAK
ncbi:MAG: UDP-2,3-diacylglucosamine diphosphatase LpxI [Alphaproteobacteria bacterium]|nr:UDP-2,3-diacylglucosamine diphosphatase LpxI [Alphaproteobacteria bacterium]MCL2758189.1 UDP-2,3-diacylglucosamine diphosphatase LpxI [Alphaproteobacteria bacterium]